MTVLKISISQQQQILYGTGRNTSQIRQRYVANYGCYGVRILTLRF